MRDHSTAPRRQTVLLTVHLLATASWFGAGLAVTVLGLAGLTGSEPATTYPAARILASWLIAPLAGLALATGLLLVATTSWGLFTHRWVTAKLAITLVLAVAVVGLLIPRLGAVAAAVTGPDPSMPTVGQRLPLALAPAAASVLLATNAALAIVKPGGRRSPHQPVDPMEPIADEQPPS
jgi:hypothetical protein